MTISQAYCLNEDIRVNAAFAAWNPELSFHCCSPRCGLPIFPRVSSAGTPHFVSRAKRLEAHDRNCPHIVGAKGSGGSPSRGGVVRKVTLLPGLPPVPDTLMKLVGARAVAFKDLPREEIAERAARAQLAGCPGDLEVCVQAYRAMDDQQRARQPFRVGDRARTYGFHFGTRSRARATEGNLFAKPSIVILPGWGEAGDEYGALTITTEADPFPITLTIPAGYASVKPYLGEFWSDLRFMGPAMVTLYWLGDAPDENGNLSLPESNGQNLFALRIDNPEEPY